MYATIYTENGELLAKGLQSLARSDACKQEARELAAELKVRVVVDDPSVPGGTYGIEPDGTYVARATKKVLA